MAKGSRDVLEALNAKIDRKKLSLRQQTLQAERLRGKTGASRESAMATIARRHLASNAPAIKTAERRRSTESTKKKFVSSGPLSRGFGAGSRRPTGKKITRRGGRQPSKKVTKITIVRPADRRKKK